MKKFIYLTTLILGLTVALSPVAKAQTADPALDKATAAIAKGDAASLAALLNSSVELTLPGADGMYQSNQAQFVLKDFFTKYPVTGFKIMHKGNSAGAFYATGSYTSAKGNFDANIYVKNVNGQFLVTAIRFEAE